MTSHAAPVPLGSEPARPSLVRLGVLGALSLAALLAYLQRTGVSVAESTIRTDLRLSKAHMGEVLGVFFLAYAVFQVPAGWLSQKLGVRIALAAWCLLWSGANWLAAAAHGPEVLQLSRALVGIAQAGAFPCAAAALSVWFPAAQRAWTSGVLAAAMQSGTILATSLTGLLLVTAQWSWRTVFATYSVPGIVWSLWFLWWFRNHPAEHAGVNAAERAYILGARAAASPPSGPPPRSAPWPWLELLRSVDLWLVCIQQFCRAFAQAFFLTWFPTYLQESREINVQSSGIWASLPVLAMLGGALFGGALSDAVLAATGRRRWARQGLSAGCLLICATLTWLAPRFEDVSGLVTVIAVAVFCSSLAGPAAYAVTIDLAGAHVATTFGVMNMVGNLGAALFPWLAPRLLAFTGHWDSVLHVSAGAYLLGAVCWWNLRAERNFVRDPPAPPTTEGPAPSASA